MFHCSGLNSFIMYFYSRYMNEVKKKILIETNEWRHRTYMSVLHILRVQKTGLYDFTVNLYSDFFLNKPKDSRLICMMTRLSVAYRKHIRRGNTSLRQMKA